MVVESRRLSAGILTAVLSTSAAYGQTIDDLSRSVVYLEDSHTIQTSSGTQTTLHYGSGFLAVGRKGDFYLITARHVASKIRLVGRLALQGKDGRAVVFELTALSADKSGWKLHPGADVAAMKLAFTPKDMEHFNGRFLDPAWIPNSKQAPPRNKTLFVVGFPLRLGVGEFLSPISRETKAASGLLDLVPTEAPASTYIVLDQPSISGFSGSPVFLTSGVSSEGSMLMIENRKPELIGIVSSTANDNTGGKLALIVPGAYLADVMQ